MRWPKLAKLLPKNVQKLIEIETKTEKAEELLKPLQNLNLTENNEDCISDVSSEISDMFDFYHKNSFLKLQPHEGFLTKNQADRKTMDGFTDNFKITMNKLRQELKIHDKKSLLLEDEIITTNKTAIKENNKEEKNLKITKIEVTDGDYLIEPIPLVNPVLVQRPESDTDSEISAVWARLAIQSRNNNLGNKFQITPPNFNVFKQNQSHWLERQPVEWKDVEKSREKCEKWLDDNFEF